MAKLNDSKVERRCATMKNLKFRPFVHNSVCSQSWESFNGDAKKAVGAITKMTL